MIIFTGKPDKISPHNRNQSKEGLMPRIEFIVDAKRKSALQSLCQNKGIKVAQLLRMMVDKVTNNFVEADDSPPDETKSESLMLRLFPSIMQKMTDRAKTEGFPSRTTWLNSLVKSVLNAQPVLTDTEANALRHSSRELAAIGRNLNQIAKVLNTEFRASDIITKEAIDTLSKKIERHYETSMALINKSKSRWGVQ